jgi:hypothetical protein
MLQYQLQPASRWIELAIGLFAPREASPFDPSRTSGMRMRMKVRIKTRRGMIVDDSRACWNQAREIVNHPQSTHPSLSAIHRSTHA